MRSIGYRLHQSTKPLLMTLPITTNDCCLDFLFKIFIRIRTVVLFTAYVELWQ